jgi:hypothetical protein
MPPTFFDDVRRFQRELGAIAGRVFEAPGARDGIMDRHLFDVAARRRAEGRAAKARRQHVARLPPQAGHRTEAPPAPAAAGQASG